MEKYQGFGKCGLTWFAAICLFLSILCHKDKWLRFHPSVCYSVLMSQCGIE